MPQLRFDPTTSEWVVFSPSRSRRPHDYAVRGEPTPDLSSNVPEQCPFCPGNEDLTPPEIYAVRPAGSSGRTDWQVRVIANNFPALRIEEDPQHVRLGRSFRYMGGCGAHEVIVESPEHAVLLAMQPVEHIEKVLRTAQLRFEDLMRDRRFQTVVIFKNHGERAGTSLAHPHWQIIATPVVPHALRLKHQIATDYYDKNGECLYCILRDDEMAAKERVIAENSEFVAYAPYASHLPFETWILPLKHQSSFANVDPNRLAPLAELLKTVLLKLNIGLENPDYNLTIDTAPRGDEDKSYFLWHIRILPRMTTTAGFELGSGMSINTVLPEEAAEFLRSVN